MKIKLHNHQVRKNWFTIEYLKVLLGIITGFSLSYAEKDIRFLGIALVVAFILIVVYILNMYATFEQ